MRPETSSCSTTLHPSGDAIHVLPGAEHPECRSASVTDSPAKTAQNASKKFREGRTRIEIDNATSAWVVQVESISERPGTATPVPMSTHFCGTLMTFSLRQLHVEDDTAARWHDRTPRSEQRVFQPAAERSPDRKDWVVLHPRSTLNSPVPSLMAKLISWF